MTNEEHVRRLRDEDVEAWNAWRETKPGVRPDLASTNLNDDYHAAFQRLLRDLKAGQASVQLSARLDGTAVLAQNERTCHKRQTGDFAVWG